MDFTYTVKVRLKGARKADREYLAEEIRSTLEEDANPGSFFNEDDREVEVAEWSAAEVYGS